MKRLKVTDEKGSITMFVLIAMLFFLGIAIALFTSTMNSSATQKRDLRKIQSEYNNTEDLNVIYEYQRDKFSNNL